MSGLAKNEMKNSLFHHGHGVFKRDFTQNRFLEERKPKGVDEAETGGICFLEWKRQGLLGAPLPC